MVQTREIINYGTRYTTTIPDAPDVFFPCQNLDGTPGHASANAIIQGVTQNVVAFLRPQPSGEWNPTTAYVENQAVHYTDPAKVNSGTYLAPSSIAANIIPPAAPWALLALDGKDGETSIARITNASPGNSPAVGSSVTYTVDSSKGFAVGRYAGIGTLSGVFLVTALTATSITFQNVDAPVGSAVATNSAIVPAGKPGTNGNPGSNGVTPGHRYTVSTSAPGANGVLQVASTTSLVLRNLDSDGIAPTGISTTLPVGSQIWIIDAASTANRVIFTTTALPTFATNNFTIAGTSSPLGTLPTTSNGVRVLVFPVGAPGASGGSGVGSGLRFFYEATEPIADIEGSVARNGASFAAATQLSFSVFEGYANNPPTSNILQRLTTGAIFEVRKSTTAFARYRSTGTPVLDASGVADCYNIPVTSEAVGPDAIADQDALYLTIINDAPAAGGVAGISGGTIAASGSADTISLTEVTPPSGSSWGPYIYNWYRANTPNFALASATLLPGTGATLNDSGLPTGTFYYRRVAIDQIGIKAASNEVSASAVSASFDPTSVAIFNEIEATGATLTGAQKTAVDNAIIAYKNPANGAIWTKIKALYLFLGGTANAHAINCKTPGTNNITWTGGVTHNADGVTGDGSTGHGLTGVEALAGEQNSFALGCYVRILTSSGDAIGIRQTVGGVLAFKNISTFTNVASTFTSGNNSFQASPSANGTNNVGSLLSNRNDSTSISFHRNGSTLGIVNQASQQAMSGGNFAVLALRNTDNGAFLSRMGGTLCSVVIFNAGLTAAEANAYTNIDLGLQTALGRN